MTSVKLLASHFPEGYTDPEITMSTRRISLFLLHVSAAALSCSALAWSAPIELAEDELAQVSGQGMVAFSNTQDGGLDFSTITLNADVTLNANFKDLGLGNYVRDSTPGIDVNIQHLRFGRSDGTPAQKLVSITNPFIQFVYDNSGGAGNSQVVGMRLGFDGIAGDVSLIASAISGSLLVDGGTVAPGQKLDLTGVRQTGSTATSTCTPSPCLNLAQIGGITAGDVNGPSRDMWISLLAKPVTFKAPAGVTEAPVTAQAGVWLNWRDRLTAYNVNPAGTPALPTAPSPNLPR